MRGKIIIFIICFCALILIDKNNLILALEQEQKTIPPELQSEYGEMQKNPQWQVGYILATQARLFELGYFGLPPFSGRLDEQTKRALVAYQHRRGLKPTGEIDLETFAKLETDKEEWRELRVPLLASYYFSDVSWEQHAFVKGTWMFEGLSKKESFPLATTTEISCYRDLGRCIESTASLSIGWTDNDSLFVDSNVYQIERWDKHEIVTKPSDSILTCSRTVISLNKAQKTAKKIVTMLEKTANCPERMEASVSVLTDGLKRWDELREARKSAFNAMSNEMSEDQKAALKALEKVFKDKP